MCQLQTMKSAIISGLTDNFEVFILAVLTLCQDVQSRIRSCNYNAEYEALTRVSYSKAGNHTVWSSCNIANPRTHWQTCGRPDKSWLCDPDHLLTETEAEEVERKLNETVSTTPCRCDEDKCQDGVGHPVVFVLVNYTRIPNRQHKFCEHGWCKLIYPQLDPLGREPTIVEQKTALEKLPETLMSRWRLGRCGDEVIFFFTKKYQYMSAVAGTKAYGKLGDTLTDALDEASPVFYEGRIKDALLIILDRYTDDLQHVNSWSFIVGIVCVAVVGVVIIVGIVITIKFCHSEFKQGKNCWQVCAGLIGGHYAFLFGGHPVRKSATRESGTLAETEAL